MSQIHAIVHGRVQGVGFRAYVKRCADDLSVRGWVRNRAEGTVETVAVAPRHTLEQFCEALRRGSVGSRVAEVEIRWQDTPEIDDETNAFEIRY